MDVLQQPPQIKGGARTLSGDAPEPTDHAHHVLLDTTTLRPIIYFLCNAFKSRNYSYLYEKYVKFLHFKYTLKAYL